MENGSRSKLGWSTVYIKASFSEKSDTHHLHNTHVNLFFPDHKPQIYKHFQGDQKTVDIKLLFFLKGDIDYTLPIEMDILKCKIWKQKKPVKP